MFGKKKKTIHYTDLIYCYKEDKLNNLAKFLNNSNTEKTLVVSSFEDNIQKVEDYFKLNNIYIKRLNYLNDYSKEEKNQIINSAEILGINNVLSETR
ncbi:MAG: hypothetical protein JXR58_10360, partial [Bacteroidales bacterium]|nr:hypothetical protein [Bacteroidales bacterium]